MPIDRNQLLDLWESEAHRTMVLHNLATLQWVVGGTEMALRHRIEFDPRDDYWYPPERRLGIAFLSTRYPRWPKGEASDALASFGLRVIQFLESLRTKGIVTHAGSVKYDQYEGGTKAVFGPIAEALKEFPDGPEWKVIRKKDDPPTAAQALELFAAEVAESGFPGVARESIRIAFRWYPYLGAATVEEALERQRYFFGFAAALRTTNAYKHAGAQLWGPLVNNTPHGNFLDALDKWREGSLPDEAPMMAMAKNDTTPSPRQNYSVGLEIWGMLNLDRGPFYNGVVADGLAPEIGEREPIEAMLGIGAATTAWLDGNPKIVKRAAAAFDAALTLAKPHNDKPMIIARRCNGYAPLDPVDEQLQRELFEAARARLGAKGDKARAAMWLHLLLDASLYKERHPSTHPPPPPDLGPIQEDDRLWLYAPGRGADHWVEDRERRVMSIGWDGLGDLAAYDSEASVLEALIGDDDEDAPLPSNSARVCWQFANGIEPEHWVIARDGRSTVIGVGRVDGEYVYRPDQEDLPAHQRSVEWLWTGSHRVDPPNSLPVTTLTDASKRDALRRLANELLDIETKPLGPRPYGITDALSDLFMDRDEVARIRRLIARRKNIVLQGPPGVGKTFFARRLAWLLMGQKDPERLQMVQFHQAYTYEHLVAGYAPTGNGGFELAYGPLYRLAEQAKSDPDQVYVLLIDEINRGNLGKILGEAMMLLEADKRDKSWGVELSYGSKDPFYLPDNLYVIGTMNTADRSLALVDYALRRRFAFVTLQPGLEHEHFEVHLEGVDKSLIQELRGRIDRVNRQILEDPNLGPGFLLGHSPYCGGPPDDQSPADWLRDVFEHEVIPLLEEYWFDAPPQLEKAKATLLASLA